MAGPGGDASNALPAAELALEVARYHAASSAGELRVLPVIVENIATCLPFLEAVCKASSGVLLRAEAPQLRKPVPITADISRRAAVASALGAAAGFSPAVIISDQANGSAECRFDPVVADPVSTGLQSVLAVGNAFLHGSLDKHELAVIAYKEAEIDFRFRRAIWNFGVEQLRGLSGGALRTLVMVSEAQIDPDLHCGVETGFTFGIADGRFLRRHSSADVRMFAASLAKRTEPWVLFLGAGFSVSSGIPLGNGLRDEAIRNLIPVPVPDLRTSHELAGQFYDLLYSKRWLNSDESANRGKYIETLTLEQVVRIEAVEYPELPTLQSFKQTHDSNVKTPGAAVTGLAKLLGAARAKIVLVTVNIDELIEEHAGVPLRTFFDDATFESAAEYVKSYLAGTESDVPLLKLHGTISEFSSCIVSRAKTETGIGGARAAALQALLPTEGARLWAYVGASMRDLDLLPLLRSEPFATRLDERWVLPWLPETVDAFGRDREPHWDGTPRRTVQDRLISVRADDLFQEIATILSVPAT